MFENPRRGRQARNFTTNVPKILDLKSSSEQIFSRKLSLGAPDDIRLRAKFGSDEGQDSAGGAQVQYGDGEVIFVPKKHEESSIR